MAPKSRQTDNMHTATTNDAISQSNPRAWRNPWVIGWITLVAVVLLVNIAMISIAFITSPGLVNENYYDRGRHYEKTLKSRIATRDALGWSISTDFPITPYINKPEKYRFNIVDKNAVPISNAQTTIALYRPSDAEADFELPMHEIVPGIYSADVRFPLKGEWEIIVSIKRDDDHYTFSQRARVAAE